MGEAAQGQQACCSKPVVVFSSPGLLQAVHIVEELLQEVGMLGARQDGFHRAPQRAHPAATAAGMWTDTAWYTSEDDDQF